jgi:hypothetical protein
LKANTADATWGTWIDNRIKPATSLVALGPKGEAGILNRFQPNNTCRFSC